MLKVGDTVILDNLNAQEVAGAREAIEAVGARVLYPPALSSKTEGPRSDVNPSNGSLPK